MPGGQAQGLPGGVGEAGEHAEGGQAAAAFDAGDRGLGMPVRGSSVWVSLVRVRRVEASSAGCPAKVAAG